MNMKISLCQNKQRKVNLRQSCLKQIPNYLITALHSITCLDIAYNSLNNQHIEIICHLGKSLKWLSIEGNYLTIIPTSISLLPHLEYLFTDWHYILEEFQSKSKGVVVKSQNSKLQQIRNTFNNQLKLVIIDGIKGINFKIFAEEIFHINLEQINSSILLKQIETAKIHEYVKDDIKNALSRKLIVNSTIINYRKFDNHQSTPCVINLVKKISLQDSPKKCNQYLKTARLSVETLDKRKYFHSPQKKNPQKISPNKTLNKDNQKYDKKKIKIVKVQEISTRLYSEVMTQSTNPPINFQLSQSYNRYSNMYPFHSLFANFDNDPFSNSKQIQNLLSLGCTPNCYNQKGITPYHLCIINNQLQGLKYVLKKNFNTNNPPFDLQMPSKEQFRNLLHFCALIKNLKAMKILVLNGYPVYHRDRNGFKSLHLIDLNFQYLANYRKSVKRNRNKIKSSNKYPLGRLHQSQVIISHNLITMFQQAFSYN